MKGNKEKDNICLWHSCDKEKQYQKFCSPQCKNKYYVDRRRKHIKQKAIEYLGGSCKICGYNKCASALVFHHTKDKEFAIADSIGACRTLEKIFIEIEKCQVLCMNCHEELHDKDRGYE